jgi:hypothetical protein
MQFLGGCGKSEGTRRDSGVVVAYPNRSYANQKALTLLNQLRQHLPNEDYREDLPTQIMNS